MVHPLSALARSVEVDTVQDRTLGLGLKLVQQFVNFVVQVFTLSHLEDKGSDSIQSHQQDTDHK